MYVDLAGLIERFGETELIQLTDRTDGPLAGVIGVTVVDQAIADTSSLIDGYIARSYRLPLAAVPAALAKAAADICRYYLHGSAAGKDDAVTRAYDSAVRWLREVASGTAVLDAGSSEAQPNPVRTAARVAAGEPLLTRDTLRVLG